MNIKGIFKSLYKLILKGKTVAIGGVKVTFPQKGHRPDDLL